MAQATLEIPVTARTPALSSPNLISEARRLFALQQAKHHSVGQTSAVERIAKLKRLQRAIEQHREAVYTALQNDFGKPQAEVELAEIQGTLLDINHTIKHLEGWMRPAKVRTPIQLVGTSSEVRYRPKGVVLILAPWNYPFLLLMGPLIAAVAAGNCAIVRPSEKVPHTAEVLGAIIADAFSPDEVALIAGDVDVADALLDLPFDHIFFTGSTAVGRKVMAAAAKHLTPVTLELGGKSPAIVDANANIHTAAERLVWGKFLNAGQTCVAPDYVLVHQSRAKAFVEAAKHAITKAYGSTGEARSACTDFCRIIDDRSFGRLTSQLHASVEQGARIEFGGRHDAANRFIEPTILLDCAHDVPIMDEEIFGPILPVLTYQTLDEAIGFVNQRSRPLALYVFTEDQPIAERVLRETVSGGAVVNHVIIHLSNTNLPFGGVGASGMGNYHGEYGFRTFSHEQAVLVQRGFSATDLFRPPYRPWMQRLIKTISRIG